MTREELLTYARRGRYEFLECPIDALTMDETLEVITIGIKEHIPLYHLVMNVAKLISMRRNRALASDVLASDLINIDGMGVVWGARLLGYHVRERVSGIDLMHAVLTRAEIEGWRPYFLGARHDVLDRAVNVIALRYPSLKVAGFHHGYFTAEEEADVATEIRAAKPDCLFVAITSPKKEQFMNRWRNIIDVPFIMGVGGSLDIVAGVVQRAPPWMQSYGLEWFYRLAQEPRRMWRRYLFTNVAYAGLLFAEMLRKPIKARHANSRREHH
jgi:N-acetylglucosaminyldiphosphoundecaprenol N-acetyl-beta-D-mannosaminyltransferase